MTSSGAASLVPDMIDIAIFGGVANCLVNKQSRPQPPDDRDRRVTESLSKPKSSPDFGLLTGLIGYQVRRAQVAIFQHFAGAFASLELTPGQLGALVLIGANS